MTSKPKAKASTTSRRTADTLPSIDQYEQLYVDLIGFVPPRIRNRLRLGKEVGPEMLDMVEKIREMGMYPKSMSVKTAQMILFGILLSHIAPAAEFHGIAAKRAGATRAEVMEASMLAAALRAGAAVTHGALAVKLFDKA